MSDNYHKEFLNRLAYSNYAVRIVALYLLRHGFSRLVINETRYANSVKDNNEFKDNGDILAYEKNGVDGFWRIEVKRKDSSFTCRDDWPFKNEVFVMSKRAWSEEEKKADYIFIVNKEFTHAGIIYGKDSETWKEREITDSKRPGYKSSILFCEKESVKFFELKVTDVEIGVKDNSNKTEN